MIVIVDYGVGNLNSIQNMLKKAGSTAIVSSDAGTIKDASKILLPGMGHFDNCMRKFNDSGLRPIIESGIFERKIPVLGICVGLQMMMQSSEEGSEKGLGWLDGETIRFKTEHMNSTYKIPNMGWLEIKKEKPSRLLNGLEESRFYFAHSYHVHATRKDDILMTANYGYPYIVALERDNIIGVQFHPEKSHRFGLQLLKNFAEQY